MSKECFAVNLFSDFQEVFEKKFDYRHEEVEGKFFSRNNSEPSLQLHVQC